MLDVAKDTVSTASSVVSKSEFMGELRNRLAYTDRSNGYAVPGARRKGLKGNTARPNSPNVDILDKLDGMRGLSRDSFMRSPLAVAILERHKINKVASGLMFQSRVGANLFGGSIEEASAFSEALENEVDLWSSSICSDYDLINHFGDNQALGFLNLLLSGDFFFLPTWVEPPETGFPFNTAIKLIDADLVRDPNKISKTDDIYGGVKLDPYTKRPVGIFVWNQYENDYRYGNGKGEYEYISFFNEGWQQVYHVVDPKRIKQNRGVPLFAPMGEALTQSTRLFDASLMYHVIANYFTAFIRDMSGLEDTLQEAVDPEETVTGGGSYGPDDLGGPYAKDVGAGSDIELGYGNVITLDNSQDVTVADPKKTDRDFKDLWNAYATVICAGSNASVGSVLMQHEESYTAARAAQLDDNKVTKVYRTLLMRRMTNPILELVATESVLKKRLEAPGFLEDYTLRKKYLRGTWIGIGTGSLQPLDEDKANAIRVNNNLDTREDIFVATRGERWDSAMTRKAREEALLKDLDLVNNPKPTEIVGPDGQDN